MKIAIIGSGNVGGALGKAWARCGHEIIFGVRDAGSEKIKVLLTEIGERAAAASVKDAAAAGEVVALAAAWEATEAIIAQTGGLAGKIVIDTNNPILPGLAGLSLGVNNSAAEEVARWAAGAQVVKAFNHIGAMQMGNPRFGDQVADIFICGDAAEAKAVVSSLIREIGFDVVDAGPLANARYLEPMAMLWINLALKLGYGPNIAFKLLRK